MYHHLRTLYGSTSGVLSGQPPYSNTGVIWTSWTTLGIDWLSGTFPSAGTKANLRVMWLCEKYFDDRLEYVTDPTGQAVGSRWYRFLLTGPSGIRLETSARTMPDDSAKQHSLIIFPGSALSTLTYQQAYNLIQDLVAIGWSPSRVDLKLDDFRKLLRPEVVQHAFSSRNIKGFRKGKLVAPLDVGCQLDSSASTMYLGRRGKQGAGKYVRVYRKDLESDGTIDSCRLELELSGDKSKDCIVALSAVDIDEWPRVILGYITAAVEFLDKSVSTRADRCPRLPWWEKIVDKISPVPFSPRVIKRSFERSLKWIKDQVLPTLAMVLNGLIIEAGGDTSLAEKIFYEWWDEGEKRFKDEHVLVLKQWSRQCSMSY